MFWKFDEDEDKVVPREEKPLTPSEFAEKAKEAGHNWPVDDPEMDEVFDKLAQDEGYENLDDMVKKQSEEFPSSDETGAEQRFEGRVAVFQKENKPVYKHHFWWFVHNCIAHPMIGVWPSKKSFDFHDWTSKKINGK